MKKMVKIHSIISTYIQSIKINNTWTVAIEKEGLKVVILKHEFFSYYPIQYDNGIIAYDYNPTKEVKKEVEYMFTIANKLKKIGGII